MFLWKKGGPMQCRAAGSAVLCLPEQQLLAVERLVRRNNDVGATCILQGTLIIYTWRGSAVLRPPVEQAVGCRTP